MVKLVKMYRDTPQFPGGPTTANVHPAEVQGWTLGGWAVVPEEKPAPVKKSGASKKKKPEPDFEDLV